MRRQGSVSSSPLRLSHVENKLKFFCFKKKNKNKFIYVCMYAAQANGGGSLGVLPRCAARAPRRSHVVCREPPVPPPSEGRTVLVRAGGPRGSIRAAGKVRPPRSHHAAAEGRQPYSGTDRERGGGAAAGPLRGGRWPRQGPGNPPGAAGFVCVCVWWFWTPPLKNGPSVARRYRVFPL